MKLVLVFCLLFPAGLSALQPNRFDCYVQSAEARMDARKAFLLADADTALTEQIVRGQKVQTIEANGPNPHKLPGGQLYDWIGTVFIPGTTLDKLVRMLQDYDHRAEYFPETISTSKLLCRTGNGSLSVLHADEGTGRHRRGQRRGVGARGRASLALPFLSTRVAEVGKDHGYLRRLNSYWRFAETEKGVFVEAETITLSDEFGSMTRTLGSALMGINPEKSLKHSLTSMRESVLKPGLEIPKLPAGLPACGEPRLPRAALRGSSSGSK